MEKAKTTKIPKRIAGVKLPKELRRMGNAAIEKAQTPQGREMIAAGLSIAAAAASAAVVKARASGSSSEMPPAPPVPPSGPVPPVPPEPPVPPVPPQGARAGDPQAAVEAMGQMAEMVLGRLFAKR
jgi:hypothetical protein